jgi:VCBS repeat-containing protein
MKNENSGSDVRTNANSGQTTVRKMRLLVILSVICIGLVTTIAIVSTTFASSVDVIGAWLSGVDTVFLDPLETKAPGAAMAGAKINKLFVDDVLTTEGYQIAAGDPIWAQATNLTSTRGYQFEVKGFDGSSVYSSVCKTGSTSLSDKFPGGLLDQFAGGAAGYKFVLHEFSTADCTGEIPPDADNTLTFYVAQIFFYRNSILTDPADPPTFNAGETVYTQVKGMAPGVTDWNTSWVKPVGTTACANTGGGDRPDADAAGALPNVAMSFLQYPPTTGAAWNTLTNYETRPCEALSSNNGGTWELKLTKSSTLSVTIEAFQAVVLTANDDSYGPNPPNQDFSISVPGVLANDINPGQGSMVANKVTDPSHGTVMLNSDGSFTYHPAHDWVGTDTFTYNVMNGAQTSNTASVTVVTGAATPTFTFQACTYGFTKAPLYPYGLAPSFTSVIFNESEVLRAFAASSDGKVIAWYNDEHALTLGVRQVNIKNSATQTLSYPADGLLGRPNFTAMSGNPASTTDPAVGWTFLKDGATSPTGLAGTDTATWNSAYGFADHSRPLWPALFITDITDDASSTAGDWQIAPIPATNMPTDMYAVAPHQVMGTWKGALRTVDKTVTPNTHVTTPDVDPSKNNWNGVPDIPPGGFARYTNEGYGAEVVWNMSRLNLIPGRRYRFQFMVHDGDQNKSGGDSGEGCMQALVSQSQLPGLMVTKTNDVNSGNPNGRITSTGQVVTYTYVVKNTGSVTLTNLVARDTNIGTAYNAAGTVFTCPKTTLLPLEQMTCTATRTIQPGDATGSPVAGSGNLVNVVTITGTKPDNNPITASDTNTIPIRINGSLKITKTLSNPDNAVIPGPFTIHYDCGSTYAGDVSISAAGGFQIINDLLAGSTCTVTEATPGSIQNYTWGAPVITGSPATIGSNTTVEVTVANTITRDRGSFKITKQVNNPDGATLPAAFTGTYNCGTGYTGSFSVAAGGSQTIGSIPTGNTCSVTETAPAAITGYTWAAPAYSPATVEISTLGGTFEIVVNNSIARDRGTFTIAKTTNNPDGATVPASFHDEL